VAEYSYRLQNPCLGRVLNIHPLQLLLHCHRWLFIENEACAVDSCAFTAREAEAEEFWEALLELQHYSAWEDEVVDVPWERVVWPILSLRRVPVQHLSLHLLLENVSILEHEQAVQTAARTHAVGQLLIVLGRIPVNQLLSSIFTLASNHCLFSDFKDNILDGWVLTIAHTEAQVLLRRHFLLSFFKVGSQIVITVEVIHILNPAILQPLLHLRLLDPRWQGLAVLLDWDRQYVLCDVNLHLVRVLYILGDFIEVEISHWPWHLLEVIECDLQEDSPITFQVKVLHSRCIDGAGVLQRIVGVLKH